jgi:hypothetical protein
MSLRALYLIISDHPTIPLFCRKFPTVENRLKKQMKHDYIPFPSDKTLIHCFYKSIIRQELLQETLKHQPYEENIEIDHSKFELLLKDISLDFSPEYFEYYSDCPIVSLTYTDSNNTIQNLWPCLYIKKHKLYAIVFPSINVDTYAQILSKNNNDVFISKKQYETCEASIALSFAFVDNLCNYISEMKTFDESKLQLLISNMLPFGSIREINFNYMYELLMFHNQSNLIKKTLAAVPYDDKSKVPGWIVNVNKSGSDKFYIEIKEELKYIKYPKEHQVENKGCNILLCDIHCKAELHKVCEITFPIKISNNNTNNNNNSCYSCLKNLRVHPCAKIEDINTTLSESTRIIFIPPNNNFILGVSEIENIPNKDLPIKVSLQLKEANQNEVKIYLKANIADNAIGKFEYFYIVIPLIHFGNIVDTKIMVQVGEVSLSDNKTSLYWDLSNKIVENTIVLSGTVFFNGNKQHHERAKGGITSDIRDNNCYCKVCFKLNDYSMSGLVVDKNTLLFYPKLMPVVDIKKSFYSNEFIVWNDLSFNNYEIVIQKEEGIKLLNVNIDEDDYVK